MLLVMPISAVALGASTRVVSPSYAVTTMYTHHGSKEHFDEFVLDRQENTTAYAADRHTHVIWRIDITEGVSCVAACQCVTLLLFSRAQHPPRHTLTNCMASISGCPVPG